MPLRLLAASGLKMPGVSFLHAFFDRRGHVHCKDAAQFSYSVRGDSGFDRIAELHSGAAQSGAGSYAFLIGSGFLCDAGDSSACPAAAKSEGGDTFEVSGAGVFNPRQKTVTATGTFTHRSLDGKARETGIWIASELVSFDPYGVAPGALMREGRALGPSQFGLMRMPMFSGSMPAGGLAVLRIRLLPVLGVSKNATLQVELYPRQSA